MSRLKTIIYGIALILIGTVILWFPNRGVQWSYLGDFLADYSHTLLWAVTAGYGLLLILRGGRKL